MFQGSENVGKGEHMILVENNGGDMNGTTNEDRTNYFEAFAANQLDLGLFLEADRMRSLVISQANLDNQRNAVQEERRLGLDNQPYGKTGEVIQELVYDNFANKHSVIGSMEDLNAATVKDVQDFFRIYYAPNNAVLTLVGDFQTREALAKIKKYFGDIPSQPAPPPCRIFPSPSRTASGARPSKTPSRRLRVWTSSSRFRQATLTIGTRCMFWRMRSEAVKRRDSIRASSRTRNWPSTYSLKSRTIAVLPPSISRFWRAPEKT